MRDLFDRETQDKRTAESVWRVERTTDERADPPSLATAIEGATK